MSRPAGSKNKPKPIGGDSLGVIAIPEAEGVPSIRYDLIFGIRFLRKGMGPFGGKGLWELVRIDNEGNRVKVITDANTKGMVIDLLRRDLLRYGVV